MLGLRLGCFGGLILRLMINWIVCTMQLIYLSSFVLSFCSVHLVELKGTGELFAMKAMEKDVMINRNKVFHWKQNCLE